MNALHCHYAGEGNTTHWIADAKRIQNTLHYKSKCALPFGICLGKLQHMLTILEEAREWEELTKHAKIDKLLSKMQYSLRLRSCISW
jgi:hypothetical protein